MEEFHISKYQRMKTFIKHKYYNAIDKLRRLHRFCNSVDEDSEGRETPYRVFFGWILDILLYGTLLTFIHNTFIGWQGLLNFALVPAYGFGIWMIGEIVSKIRKGND
jgi:hypothetical protein